MFHSLQCKSKLAGLTAVEMWVSSLACAFNLQVVPYKHSVGVNPVNHTVLGVAPIGHRIALRVKVLYNVENVML